MHAQQESTPQTPLKEILLYGLLKFANQRSGIDWRNYYSTWSDKDGVAAFKQEYREILKDGRDARALIGLVWRKSAITPERIIQRSHGGRLTYSGTRWEYCTGQYFCTEYRAAVCRLCVSLLWDYAREQGYDTREKIQKWARGELGRGIVSRWFV